MSVSLEKLAKGNEISLIVPSQDEFNPESDILALLKSSAQQSGLQVDVKPLEYGVVDFQTKDNPFLASPRLTYEQFMAIMYIIPGHSEIELGQLQLPVMTSDMDDLTTVEVQTIVIANNDNELMYTYANPDHNPFDNSSHAFIETKSNASTWDIYSVGVNGEVSHIGFLT